MHGCDAVAVGRFALSGVAQISTATGHRFSVPEVENLSAVTIHFHIRVLPDIQRQAMVHENCVLRLDDFLPASCCNDVQIFSPKGSTGSLLIRSSAVLSSPASSTFPDNRSYFIGDAFCLALVRLLARGKR